MNILILLTFLFISYNSVIYFRFGLLPSISDSYYKLETENKGFIFNLFIWFISLGFIFSSPNLLFTIGCILLLGVSTSPLFKDNNIDKYIHSLGAIIGIFLALLSLVIYNGFYYPISIVIGVTSLFNILKIKSKIYWIEVVSFTIILITLFYLL